MALLKIEKLTYGHIKGPVVVNDFSAIQDYGTIFLFGEKGSGKTTLLELLCGMNDLYYGKILIDGKKPQEATGEISYLPSEPVLFGSKSVWQNMIFGATSCAKTEKDIVADDWIKERAKQKAKKLSLAEQQILCIKRSQIKNPKLLLIDIDLSEMKEDELKNYVLELKNVAFAENRLTIIACSADDYRKMQIDDSKCSIWYQNASKILKFDDFMQFSEKIEYLNMLDYLNKEKLKAQILSTENGYYLNIRERTLKIADKYVKDIALYFEISSSADIYICGNVDDVKNDAEFNNQIANGQIMLFDAITTQRLK